MVVTDQIRGGEPQFVQILKQNVRIHNAHDHFFAEGHRNRRNTDFNLYPCLAGFDPAVLGSPLLGHIHSGEVFDPADNCRMHFSGQPVDGVK